MTIVRPLLLSLVLLSGCAAPSGVDPPPPGASFPHSLGSARAQDSGATCSVGLSAPSGSPLRNQHINFVLNRGTLGSWSAQEFPVATGASKTLAELQVQLASALHRGITAPAGSELIQVGDLKYGGEVRLIARGGGVVDFIYQPAVQGGNPSLSAGETAAFARLLGK